jgi:hypothetical protein
MLQRLALAGMTALMMALALGFARSQSPNGVRTLNPPGAIKAEGSTALANELMLLGKKYATGVIVTQVVPALEGHSSLVLDYKSALAKYFPARHQTTCRLKVMWMPPC